MNNKLIIVWCIGILIFAFIGIFGYLNRDLPTTNKVYEYKPIVNDNVTKSCKKTLENGESTYTFFFNKDNQIDRLNIRYKASNINVEAYSAASNINNSSIKGVTTNLSGSTNDFTFTFNVDLNDYDKTLLDSLNSDLQKLSMLISQVNDYETYKNAINNLDTSSKYICD